MEQFSDEDRVFLTTIIEALRAEGPKWTVPPSKLDRALAAVLAGRVEPGYPEGLYHVQGTQGRYTVTHDGCTCPSSQKGRSIYCVHMTAVELYQRWQDARHGSGQAQLFARAPTTDQRLAAEPEEAIDFTTGELTTRHHHECLVCECGWECPMDACATTVELTCPRCLASSPDVLDVTATEQVQENPATTKEDFVPTETLQIAPESDIAIEAPSSPAEPSRPAQEAPTREDAATLRAQRAQIVAHLKTLGRILPGATKTDFEHAIGLYTDLELLPENYEAILAVLAAAVIVQADTSVALAPVSTPLMAEMVYQHSARCGELMRAFAQAQAEMPNPERDGYNPFFNSRYPTLASVRDAVIPALTKYGIAAVQLPETGEGWAGCTTILWYGEQYLKSFLKLPVTKQARRGEGAPPPGPLNKQDYAATLTYVRRISMQAVCNVAGEEDDDGNTGTQAPKEGASQGQRRHAG